MTLRIKLAAVFQSTDRFAEADEQYGKVRTEFSESGNMWTDEYGGILKRMQFNYEAIGNVSGAIEVVQQFIDLRLAASGNEDATYASALCDLGLLLPRVGKVQEAIELCQEAARIQSEFFQDQMRLLTDQARGMGETAMKAATGMFTPKS